MRPLLESISNALTVHGLLPGDRRLLVAASGGVDSQVLLHALHHLAGPLQLRLTVAHAHHQLRGRAADADAELVAESARVLGWPVISERLPVADAHAESVESLEMTARRLRHEFLARVAKERDISTVALAHHADDQAELVLLRLLRGAGGDGIGGMGWSNPSSANPEIQLIRPLLSQTRTDLLTVARDAGIPFREDGSNRDRRFLRNRVRHQLLPFLERQFNPAIRRLLVRTADLVGADAAHVADEARRWRLAKRRRRFGSLSLAIQRSILRQEVRTLGHEPGFELVERLRLHSGRAEEISPGRLIHRTPEGQIVEMSRSQGSPFSPGEIALRLRPSGGTLALDDRRVDYRVRIGKPGARRRAVPWTECFSAQAVGTRINLRYWRPGDRFQPLGFAVEAKLKDLFIKRKVPAERRRGLLVATTAAGKVFWVESLPPGEPFKVRASTRRILVWKCRCQT